jgi:N,N'-diacetyllegionaminate synthase
MSSGGVKIIAEAAQGFEGDVSLACMLVRAAAFAKADAIKFQLVYADELATPGYAYYDLFHKLEIPDAGWAKVAREAREVGLELIFDVFGPRSVCLAKASGAAAVKIHTTDFFNHALVRQALSSFATVYFSAGGISVEEIEAFLHRYRSAGAQKLVMLYGFQAEPTAVTENNLRRLAALRGRFRGLRFGFMDHCAGDTDEAGWLAVLCLPYGIEVIEKHITLDRSLQLEDYVSALAPGEFGRFVARIRAAEAALGQSSLEPTEAERAYRRKVVKKVTATRDLAEEEVIGLDDVTLLRSALIQAPGGGANMLEQLEDAIGRQTRRAIRVGEAIYQEDLK